MSKSAYRTKLISLVHIAKNQLAMDDDTYRALLHNSVNKNSCSKMNVQELNRVIDALKQRGFAMHTKGKTQGKPHNFDSDAMPLMITKIEALLAEQNLPWAYADGIAKQMFGIQKCTWLREPKQLKAIIAALYNKQQKQVYSEGGD